MGSGRSEAAVRSLHWSAEVSQDGLGSPTRLLATKLGWLRAVSSNLWVRVFSQPVRWSKSTAFARDGRLDRRKTLLGQISAATLYLRFCQKQRNLMCRSTICRPPVGRACFNPMQTPTLRRPALALSQYRDPAQP